MSRAQHILAVIVGLITAVLLMESYGAMVTAARAGGRAIPELWPLGTEALALAMEVSVLEAKRLHHSAVLWRSGAARRHSSAGGRLLGAGFVSGCRSGGADLSAVEQAEHGEGAQQPHRGRPGGQIPNQGRWGQGDLEQGGQATEATSSSHDSRSTARCPRRLASRTLTSMASARASGAEWPQLGDGPAAGPGGGDHGPV